MPLSPFGRRPLLAAAVSALQPLMPAVAAEAGMEKASWRPALFRSFFMAGFECSSHQRADGRRLDLIARTRHDELALQDYRQVASHGLASVRDGLRWHLIEPGAPGAWDWSSLLPMLRAAEQSRVQVIWDLCHYGWPDGLDVFSPTFPDRLARMSAAFARLHLQETGRAPLVCPVNEISFLAWAGGDMATMNPMARGRGGELKRQLVRAFVAAAHAVRGATGPEARVIAVEPLIHVVPRQGESTAAAAAWSEAQYEACDMLLGRLEPGLGGAAGLLDAVGVNYYWNNQWELGGGTLDRADTRHRPLRELLAAAAGRHERPIFISETSIEGEVRAPWLRHVAEEAREAVRAGVPLEGICLYPVLSHPGWDDDRYCPNGLLEMAPVQAGLRPVHVPLAVELERQQAVFRTLFTTA